jgi:hypothetical protein
MIIPSMIIPESCYLLNTYLSPSAKNAFMSSLAKREFSVEHFADEDIARCLELMEQYGDMNIGFADIHP